MLSSSSGIFFLVTGIIGRFSCVSSTIFAFGFGAARPLSRHLYSFDRCSICFFTGTMKDAYGDCGLRYCYAKECRTKPNACSQAVLTPRLRGGVRQDLLHP